MRVLDLWYVRTDEVRADDLLRACDAVQSPEERERGRSFVFEKNRHEHLVTRALCRGVLARYVGCAPRELAFRRNAYGRPELAAPGDLRFNLTNTVALVACAVTRGRDVGVDAEPLARADDILDIAETVFTSRERAYLASLDLRARREHAARLWTCKEAYMKARGLGMSLPPETFEVDPVLDLSSLTPDAANAGRWRLSAAVVEDHMMAICIEESGAPWKLAPVRADLRALLGLR